MEESGNFTIVQPFVDVLSVEEFGEICDKCVKDIVRKGSDGTMYADSICGSDECRDSWIQIYIKSRDLFCSDPFEQFLQRQQFDLVIAEHMTQLALLAVTNSLQIPFINYTPEIVYVESRATQNLPQFFASEPGIVNSVFNQDDTPPGLWERSVNFANFALGFHRLLTNMGEVMEPVYQRYNM
eukprot:sb/3471507/